MQYVQKLSQPREIVTNPEYEFSRIGAIISSLSNLKKYQGGLKIINVFASVRKVFELTKLTSFFEIFDSEDDAVSSFAG